MKEPQYPKVKFHTIGSLDNDENAVIELVVLSFKGEMPIMQRYPLEPLQFMDVNEYSKALEISIQKFHDFATNYTGPIAGLNG